MGGIIMARTMQAQMITLSDEIGKGILAEIRASKITPYSVLKQKSKMIETDILKERAYERQQKRTGIK